MLALARAYQALGVGGLLGLALLAFAAAIAASAWSDRAREREATTSRLALASPPTTRAAPERSEAPRLALPSRTELPALIARLERAATDSGLNWAAAEYRPQPASESRPASIEIHCKLVAPYPKLRQFISATLQSLPATTFKQMSFRRASSASADVEASLTLAIYIADQ
jgi:HAMP domain-containing protein